MFPNCPLVHRLKDISLVHCPLSIVLFIRPADSFRQVNDVIDVFFRQVHVLRLFGQPHVDALRNVLAKNVIHGFIEKDGELEKNIMRREALFVLIEGNHFRGQAQIISQFPLCDAFFYPQILDPFT